MGRAWGPQLQIPFGPQHRPDGKEEAADLLVGVGWGASVSKLQEKPAQLLTAKKKPTRQNPASISLRPFSLLDAEIGNDATTY